MRVIGPLGEFLGGLVVQRVVFRVVELSVGGTWVGGVHW